MACSCCGELTKEGWLRLVIVQATVLVMVQIYAGLFAHSLALLSDAVHGVIDVFTYALAYLAERIKASSLVGKRNQRAARVVDLVGFGISVTFIGLASFYVTDAACERISQRQLELVDGSAVAKAALVELAHPTKADHASVNGRIMLAFAAVTTVCNLAVAAMYSDKEEAQLGRGSKGLGKSKPSFLTKAHNLFHFHGPSCDHVDFGPMEEQESINLNILIQWVHVVMDGLRGLLMLVCSGMMCMGWVDAAMTDAVLSIAVCVMVVCGSIGMVPKAYRQLRTVIDETPADWAEPLVKDESEPLMRSSTGSTEA